ncbi:hypothetical protein A3C98_03955 [Candidatus Roizmanbacteria bacterium RIFCSPHIGHO2_02_FULL_37_15]|uniref:Uncharacterized protein n=1 Tax=Candidatus Roizmanbacteria bacterium RIFCSPLOWO2_01_FULL_37_16 TaxID=1802058 RepID=A0A1F7IML2_9BACT|nr:MAG: hypothetical protein A2859_04305 [Candidatus Roizmanbacteria bacterium RIFCSPHIGHO2_01_FULL_37_16b]OGK22477.1 MAG: hypothetical protein A3C98_03955 [Candidatus Roizmanbacteria bacterium RIFCSPHIGHO2_02_FULL_37_15]OGK33537.1 MAG: hypothetical protein A3F57_05525 [Candidatus Roizmanbacteria bacterium RIFCSPHIGHO2_12_FULL_36_11]OGK44595.1 MAG: hypothetical protein A3B40_05425 [Candidatus Roizmanbacteria bacterium RIFCSPLOWO2_01_FULL_37_16]
MNGQPDRVRQSFPERNLRGVTVLTPEQQEGLSQLGYSAVVKLSGLTINELIAFGYQFNSNGEEGLSPIERGSLSFGEIPSRVSQVAVNPTDPFLADSGLKSLNEQIILIKKLSEQLSAKVPGVRVVVGHASDYAELVLRYLADQDVALIRPNIYARTVTSVGHNVVSVGFDPASSGLILDDWPHRSSGWDLRIFPLIVPSGKRT